MSDSLTAARFKYTLNADNTSEQLATSGGIHLISVIITGGSGGAAVRIYDSPAGAGEPSPSADSFLLSANAGESTCYCPARPVLMNKGLYIEGEQFSGNAEAFVTYDTY